MLFTTSTYVASKCDCMHTHAYTHIHTLTLTHTHTHMHTQKSQHTRDRFPLIGLVSGQVIAGMEWIAQMDLRSLGFQESQTTRQ